MSQIDCRIEQSTGRITLRRPEALNALTHEMCERLEVALMAWKNDKKVSQVIICLLYTSPSPRDLSTSRMPSSA